MESAEIVEQYIAAWNGHKPEDIVALFHEEGSYWDPVVGQDIPGVAVEQYAQALITGFPDFQFEILSMKSIDDTVVFEWVMKGQNTGPMEAHPTTNQQLALPGVDVITVKDGKLLSVKAYMDRTAYAEQLGLMPQADAA